MRATDRLSALVRVELWQLLGQTDTTQVELSHLTGFSPKHINQMLQGKAGISAENADELLAVFGRQLVIATAPKPDVRLPAVIANGKRGANARPPAPAAVSVDAGDPANPGTQARTEEA